MIKFIKNKSLDFKMGDIKFKEKKQPLDLDKHPYNKKIPKQYRVASESNRVFHEDLPGEIKDYLTEGGVDLNSSHVQLHIQQPGQLLPLHRDNYTYASKKFNHEQDNLTRLIIFMSDWAMGEVLGVEDECFTKWKSGDWYTFSCREWHWSVNAGYQIKYTLIITGLSNEFAEL